MNSWCETSLLDSLFNGNIGSSLRFSSLCESAGSVLRRVQPKSCESWLVVWLLLAKSDIRLDTNGVPKMYLNTGWQASKAAQQTVIFASMTLRREIVTISPFRVSLETSANITNY